MTKAKKEKHPKPAAPPPEEELQGFEDAPEVFASSEHEVTEVPAPVVVDDSPASIEHHAAPNVGETAPHRTKEQRQRLRDAMAKLSRQVDEERAERK